MFAFIELWNIPDTEFITPQAIGNQVYIATDKQLLIAVD